MDCTSLYRSAPLRAVRVSKGVEYYKEYKIVMFLLFFELTIEKNVTNFFSDTPKLEMSFLSTDSQSSAL